MAILYRKYENAFRYSTIINSAGEEHSALRPPLFQNHYLDQLSHTQNDI